MKLLIRQGKLVDPVGGIGGVMDILLEDGKIAVIGSDIREPDALAEALPEADRALLQTARRVKGEGIRPEEMNTLSAMLLRWASDKIITL